MANVLIIGGGFGGVVAAESLAQRLGPEHQITLVSRHREFTFFPALVRLAFGRCALEDVFYDLERAMLSRRIEFVQAEILSLDHGSRAVIALRGGREVKLSYDYLVFALGRRLAVEQVPGLSLHAHHLLTVGDSLKFREAIKSFKGGHAVIGYCPDSRLSVPVYETAFALDRDLRERGRRDQAKISIISPDSLGGLLGGEAVVPALQTALEKHGVDFISDFSVDFVTAENVFAKDSRRVAYDLLMLVPPFRGLYDTQFSNITDRQGYVRVDDYMRSTQSERFYAVGDAVGFPGPKMAHLAALQGEVAAANIAAEIEGRQPEIRYDHQMTLVIDEGGEDSIYLHHKLWEEGETIIRQGRFWGWAKQVHEKYWTRLRSLKPVA
ncbi:MAG TPA: FAD-dependent oxidoreductase [Blastocatellia bacterium]|nr:FAD-dependent oxidoreductase [Blastocatellia bacterium]